MNKPLLTLQKCPLEVKQEDTNLSLKNEKESFFNVNYVITNLILRKFSDVMLTYCISPTGLQLCTNANSAKTIQQSIKSPFYITKKVPALDYPKNSMLSGLMPKFLRTRN